MIGTVLKGMEKIGCSPFFMTSAGMSFFNGRKNRKLSLENAQKDIDFQKELEIQKQQFNDEREAADWAYKKWLKSKQRDFEREESCKRLQNEYDRRELRLFFKDWPLRVDINAILNLYGDKSKGEMPLHIIIGKSYIGKYGDLTDAVTHNLDSLCITSNEVFRFCDDNKINGGAALANIYALMNKIPTVMIMPQLIEDNLLFNVGIWGQDSDLPLQKSLFSIECNTLKIQGDKKYYEDKVKEIILSETTIAGVINDGYRIIEQNKPPVFPEFAKNKGITDYPHLKEFAIKEYQSLLESPKMEMEIAGKKMIAGKELYTNKECETITDFAKNAINTLN